MNAKDQALTDLLTWAKTCVEETRAQVGWPEPGEDVIVPSWLPELEAAIESYEVNA